jgi:hypothetical protein
MWINYEGERVFDGVHTITLLRSSTPDPTFTYMPVLASRYAPLTNGGFQRSLSGWQTARGKFQGHGKGLPVSLDDNCTALDGAEKHCAVIGAKNKGDGAIPVGYGTLKRTITVRERYLDVLFRLWTDDLAWSTQQKHYFDTFEVSVDKAPDEIKNSDRDSQNCKTPVVIPPGGRQPVSVPADGGLVYCGGGDSSKEPGTRWNSQWVTLRLDLREFVDLDGDGDPKPTAVDIYLTVWSREYEDPFRDDQAYYNTWVYVDKVSETGP